MAEYVKGAGEYEAKLKGAGYDVGALIAGGQYGNNINPGEYAAITANPSPLQQEADAAQAKMQQIAGQSYQFNPDEFLPGIQAQADSIYNPQLAQLEAIRLLQQSQYGDTKTQTAKDFDDQLQSEIESINNRGAYFSGGAIAREGDIGDAKSRSLAQLGLQADAANFGNLAQQAGLSAEQTQFITNQLYNVEGSAYNRWSDNRDFSYGAAKDEYGIYQDERNFTRDVFESDRGFDEQQRQFEKNYSLSEKEFDMAKDRFDFDKYKYGNDYALDMAQFSLSKAKAYAGTKDADEINDFSNSLTSGFGEITRGTDGNVDTVQFKNFMEDAYKNADTSDKLKTINDFVLRSKYYLNPNDFSIDK